MHAIIPIMIDKSSPTESLHSCYQTILFEYQPVWLGLRGTCSLVSSER